MKLIHSIARQLSLAEDRNKELEQENNELRNELACIKARITGQPDRGIPSSLKRKRSITPEHELPSYARPTTTSRLRSSPSSCPGSRSTSPSTDRSSSPFRHPKIVRINKKSCVFKDGQLDLMEFGYLRPTVASRSRDEDSLLKRDRLRGGSSNIDETTEASSWGYSSDPWYDVDDAGVKEELAHNAKLGHSENLEEIKPANTLRIMSERELNDMVTQKGIEKRTRLDDDDWTRGSAHRVYIDHDTLFDILSEAEALAKRCLWEWLHTYRPYECLLWVGYISDVDFGRERLMTVLRQLPTNCFTHRHTKSSQVNCRLIHLIRLRNYLHHFNGKRQLVNEMDDSLKTVQELAVLLYDEEAASQARALRDRLRDAAQRTVWEIETFMMFKSLPESGILWKPHHMDLIWDAASGLDENPAACYFSPIAYVAAREWMSVPWSWDCGVSQPETEQWPSVEAIATRGPELLDTTQGVEHFCSGRTNHAKLFRRHSVSAELERKMFPSGEWDRTGTRRRAASVCIAL